MLSYQTVNSHTLELLKKLTNEEFLSKARLVGGTALALQYGHRISIDLDFFGNIEEDNETIKEVLINIGKLSVIKESKNIKIYILDDIKIDFVNYRYNWLDPAIEENGIRLASPRDIAAMKINAIEGRGRHYKIFCVNGNTGFRNESRIFYFIHLQNEEAYERKESSSA